MCWRGMIYLRHARNETYLLPPRILQSLGLFPSCTIAVFHPDFLLRFPRPLFGQPLEVFPREPEEV